MKAFRAIPMIFALIAVCATGGAMAQEEAQPVQAAQTREAAPSGDNRPATLGDIRSLRAEMHEMGRELRGEIQQLRMQNLAFYDSLNNALLAIVGIFATMMAGFATLVWKNRSGNPSGTAAVFLIPVALAAALTVGAAIAAIV